MLSRVAESIYWMSRYLERAENIARFLEVNWHLTLDLPGGEFDQWKALVDVTGDVPAFNEKYQKADKETDFILLPSLNHVGTTYDDIQWAALLRTASALQAYRQKFGRILPQNVAEFLLFDREFPRAVLHCLTHANCV